jgi:hypothetical protein
LSSHEGKFKFFSNKDAIEYTDYLHCCSGLAAFASIAVVIIATSTFLSFLSSIFDELVFELVDEEVSVGVDVVLLVATVSVTGGVTCIADVVIIVID